MAKRGERVAEGALWFCLALGCRLRGETIETDFDRPAYDAHRLVAPRCAACGERLALYSLRKPMPAAAKARLAKIAAERKRRSAA